MIYNNRKQEETPKTQYQKERVESNVDKFHSSGDIKEEDTSREDFKATFDKDLTPRDGITDGQYSKGLYSQKELDNELLQKNPLSAIAFEAKVTQPMIALATDDYTPELNKILERYKEKGVKLYLGSIDVEQDMQQIKMSYHLISDDYSSDLYRGFYAEPDGTSFELIDENTTLAEQLEVQYEARYK